MVSLRRILVVSGLLAATSLASAQTPLIRWSYQAGVGQFQPLDFSPDGVSLVHGTVGTFRTFRVKDGVLLKTFTSAQTYALSGLTFSPDSTKIYAASMDASLQTWTAEGALALTSWPSMWSNAAVSPDGTRLAVGVNGSGMVRILHESNHGIVGTFVGHSGAVYWIAYSNDGQRLASIAADGKVIVRETATMSILWSFQAHAGVAKALAFSPDGNRIVTGGNDGNMRVWDIPSQLMVAELPQGGTVNSVAWSPDGRGIAAASMTPAIRFYKGSNYTAVATYTNAMGEGPMRVAFSRNNSLFAYSRMDGLLVMAINPLLFGSRG